MHCGRTQRGHRTVSNAIITDDTQPRAPNQSSTANNQRYVQKDFWIYLNLTLTSNLSETWTATNRISVCRTYMGIIVGDAVEIVVILFCFPMFVFYG